MADQEKSKETVSDGIKLQLREHDRCHTELHSSVGETQRTILNSGKDGQQVRNQRWQWHPHGHTDNGILILLTNAYAYSGKQVCATCVHVSIIAYQSDNRSQIKRHNTGSCFEAERQLFETMSEFRESFASSCNSPGTSTMVHHKITRHNKGSSLSRKYVVILL